MREKTVFISHSSKDNELALRLGTAIEDAIGKDVVWVDLHNLSLGEELAPTITQAIGKAKWFILIASKDAMGSRWVEHEAKLAVFEAIEKDDFAILTLKIDDCDFPPSLDLQLRSRRYIDAREDLQSSILEVVDLIKKQSSTRTNEKTAFVDRGRELDRLELLFDDSNVIYVVGWHGIGKTSLIHELANVRLGRPYIKVDITPGHDLELLCRQIIGLTGGKQPPKNENPVTVAEVALSSLSQYQEAMQGFLLIDDAENSMNDYGEFRPFLTNFIRAYRENSALKVPIVINLVQRPEIALEEADDTQIQIVRPLPDAFIRTLVSRLYFAIKGQELPETIDIDQVLSSIGGHPLAAKFLASYLAFESPQILERRRFITSFRKNVAEYILRSFKATLTDLEVEILQLLAVSHGGLTISDLISLFESGIAEDGSEEVLEALSRLSNRILIDQEGELVMLHPFLNSFFYQQVTDSGNINMVAARIGDYCFNQTRQIESKLVSIDSETQPKEFRNLNIQLLRYAVPAHRLLMFSGETQKADELPFLLKGHIREMVFHSYQATKDYQKTIEYANSWLELERSDVEILLYKARALRRLGENLEAEKILDRISNFPGDRLKAIVAREYGFMARDEGDYETAVHHFSHAISIKNSQGNPIYPLALGDLASALVQKANLRGEMDPERKRELERAIELFETAQQFISNFDEYMLPTYVDALIGVGQETKALELLNDAIYQYPSHGLLNLRMADYLRKKAEGSEEALEYAERAVKGGQSAGLTLMATIHIDRGRADEALDLLSRYIPTNPNEVAVASTIKARALIALNEYDAAENLLSDMDRRNDPLIRLNEIDIAIGKAENYFYGNEPQKARSSLTNAVALWDAAVADFPFHSQFESRQTRIDQLKTLLRMS